MAGNCSSVQRKPARRMKNPKSSRCCGADGLAVGGFLLAALLTPAYAATTCESLSSLSLPQTTITLAQSVAPGAFTVPAGNGRGRGGDPNAAFKDLPAFCRV